MAANKNKGSVSEYKRILHRVLEQRPSGTRKRLAEELGKNRSFISQISNPAYKIPVPPKHLEQIFETCHFSARERERFLDAYRKVHPKKFAGDRKAPKTRSFTITVPDFESAEMNREFERLMKKHASEIASLMTTTD